MTKHALSLFCLILALLAYPLAASASNVSQQDHTRISLLPEYDHVSTSDKTLPRLAILIEMQPGWHIYWENPGDSGLAPTITWKLPDRFTAGEVDWPTPHVMNEGILATYAYDKNTLLPVPLTGPPNITGDEMTFGAHVDLLVCNEICIPESADLTLTLPVNDTPLKDSELHPIFQKHDAISPRMIATPGEYSFQQDSIELSIPLHALGEDTIDTDHVQLFIRQQNVIQYATMQDIKLENNRLQITLTRAENGETPKILSGILSITPQGDQHRAYNVSFTNQHAINSDTFGERSMIFPLAFLLALLGGVILNLMPCVLPVLSLKAVALIKKGGSSEAHAMRQGIAYTAGIMFSFTIISGMLLILRAGGESVGWGYQMQSPAFVGALIYLLFLVGLSLSGFFHLPVIMGNVGHKLTAEDSVKSSFFTGMLATAVATPCTAPFMAPAIGAALTMPAWQSLLIFEALGLGLALPFLLISIFPALRAFLPKPGAWMETFKQIMAFPMYASVIWLLWVLTLQTGASGMVMALTALLLFVIIIWARRLFTRHVTAYPWFATLSMLLIAIWSLSSNCKITENNNMVNFWDSHQVETYSYSSELIEQLQDEGKPVWVDATAAWCITCQVNAKVALHTDETMKAFKEKGVVLVIADWTNRSPEITRFLDSFGYNGVPLNVYYPPGGQPVILPQLLSEDIVLKTISKTGE